MKSFLKIFMFFMVILIDFISISSAESLLDKMRDDPDLSQFFHLLEQDKIAMSALELRSVTLFVPTNQAFQHYTGSKTYVLYHMATISATLEQLLPTVVTDLEGNPPLYIAKHRDQGQDHIYVNNALVIKSRSNVEVVNDLGKRQVLHVIDDVLMPLTLNPVSSITLYNPDAYQFLVNSESFDIGSHRIRSYRQRVIMMKKEDVFKAAGGHTFLIPIEEGFKPSPRPELIDKKVIDGHVIPNHVIFTAAAPLESPQTTLAFEDNIKVAVSFFSGKDGVHTKMYVKSNTMVGDSKHTTGVVLAEIVKANIPVRNGVVHLIHSPLMVVDTTVTQFLKSFKIVNEKEDGPLGKFYEVIMDVGGQFMEDINNLTDVTILAPSNEAWSDPTVFNDIRNREKMREILNLHIIKERLNVEKIRQRNQNMIAQVATNTPYKFLYFNIIRNAEGNETVTIEGGGVNASVVQADIVQTNGYIHIIDRVLGIPYTTVYGKLSTDPMMNATFVLGNGAGFNDQLNDTTKRFTYFVPRDKAWRRTETQFPSTHKKLFMKAFVYHARSILERHLVIAGQYYTMNDLKSMPNESVVLHTVRDSLKIRVREQGNRYSIFWNYRWINVYRPDVLCTNGIIHVIDEPFLEDGDIRVTGGA